MTSKRRPTAPAIQIDTTNLGSNSDQVQEISSEPRDDDHPFLNVPFGSNVRDGHRSASVSSHSSVDGGRSAVSSYMDEEERQKLLTIGSKEEEPSSPFAFKPFQLAKLVDPKNLDILR